MPKLSAHLASAMILASSAFEMLIDAATELKDAGDQLAFQELTDHAGTIFNFVEKLRLRKAELEASELANDNDPKS